MNDYFCCLNYLLSTIIKFHECPTHGTKEHKTEIKCLNYLNSLQHKETAGV